jgi:hypothetical protein
MTFGLTINEFAMKGVENLLGTGRKGEILRKVEVSIVEVKRDLD